jgi:hypothetical protein
MRKNPLASRKEWVVRRAKGYFLGSLRPSHNPRACRPFTTDIMTGRTGSYERGSGEADSLACPESEEDTGPRQRSYNTSVVTVTWPINTFSSSFIAIAVFFFWFPSVSSLCLLLPTSPEELIYRTITQGTDLCQSPTL